MTNDQARLRAYWDAQKLYIERVSTMTIEPDHNRIILEYCSRKRDEAARDGFERVADFIQSCIDDIRSHV